jgi:hypothetical protein
MSNYEFGMGVDMDMEMQMPMERDHSPLPDVDPELFADFSFENASTSTSTTNQHSTKAGSIAGIGSEEALDPASPARPLTSASSSSSPSASLARIDTSIPPFSHSTQSSSASGSPPPSGSDISSSDVRLSISSYLHLDTEYASESSLGMGMYDQYSPLGMGMGGMYAYDVDPVVSSQGMEEEGGYLHEPKPIRSPTATEANFAQELGAGGDEGAYFESA